MTQARVLDRSRLAGPGCVRSSTREVVSQAGLVEAPSSAIDGTKVKANASGHSAMSNGRMKQEDERISREIDAWFKTANEVPAEEDRLYGEDKRGDELPEELQTAEGRRKAIRKAMPEIEKEAERSCRG